MELVGGALIGEDNPVHAIDLEREQLVQFPFGSRAVACAFFHHINA